MMLQEVLEILKWLGVFILTVFLLYLLLRLFAKAIARSVYEVKSEFKGGKKDVRQTESTGSAPEKNSGE